MCEKNIHHNSATNQILLFLTADLIVEANDNFLRLGSKKISQPSPICTTADSTTKSFQWGDKGPPLRGRNVKKCRKRLIQSQEVTRDLTEICGACDEEEKEIEKEGSADDKSWS